MTFSACRAEIEAAAAGAVPPEDLAAILDRLATDIRRAPNPLEITGLAEPLADRIAILTNIDARNNVLNTHALLAARDRILSRFGEDPMAGLKALITSEAEPAVGMPPGLAGTQATLYTRYLGGLFADMEAEGLMGLFARNFLDESVAAALWRPEKGTGARAGRALAGEAEAALIARIIRKWQRVIHDDSNRAGDWVAFHPGFLLDQVHDPLKLRGVGYEVWRDRGAGALVRADDEPVDPQTLYEELVSDRPAGGDGAETDIPPIGRFGRTMTYRPPLRFVDAEAWHNYNRGFGPGTVRGALQAGIARAARRIAILRLFGPAGVEGISALAAALGLDLSDKTLATVSTEGGLTAARGRSDQARRVIAKLNGGATPSLTVEPENETGDTAGRPAPDGLGALPDTLALVSTRSGDGLLDAMAIRLGKILNGRTGPAAAPLFKSFFRAMAALPGAPFPSVDSGPGSASRAQRMRIKLNLRHWWVEAVADAVTQALASHLAGLAVRSWDALDPQTRAPLESAGFDAALWPELASAVVAGDPPFLAPERLANRDLADTVRDWLSERTFMAISAPALRAQGTLVLPSAADGAIGQFLHATGGWIGFTALPLRPDATPFEPGPPALAEGLAAGTGEVAGFAQLLLWSLLAGYGLRVIEAHEAGAPLPDGRDPDVLRAAMVAGGGAALLHDFMLGELPPDVDAEDPNEGDLLSLISISAAIDVLTVHLAQEAARPGTAREVAERRNGGPVF